MNNIKFSTKKFSKLTLDELYALLRLREIVFEIEQNCVYPDLDNKDQKALHILGKEGENLVAYARIFGPGMYFEEASIGRVVTIKKVRKKGYGHKLMSASIDAIHQKYGEVSIKLSAQEHLQKFYNAHHFQSVGKGYLEDGIPHIAMVRTQ